MTECSHCGDGIRPGGEYLGVSIFEVFEDERGNTLVEELEELEEGEEHPRKLYCSRECFLDGECKGIIPPEEIRWKEASCPDCGATVTQSQLDDAEVKTVTDEHIRIVVSCNCHSRPEFDLIYKFYNWGVL